jgi:hypothetical protein
MTKASQPLLEKRTLVVSDSSKLATVIAVSLKQRFRMHVVARTFEQVLGKGALPQPEPQPEGPLDPHSLDLVILAVSSPSSEPITLLAQASLAEQIGHMPLLIISDRPFSPNLEYRILHLDFPFDMGRLCDRVKEILNGKLQEHRA